MGASAGFTFRYVGFPGKLVGKLAARRVDRGLHVPSRGIDVATKVELQSDSGRSQLADRSHLVDAGDAAKLPFQRGRHR